MARGPFVLAILVGLLGCSALGPEEHRLEARADSSAYERDPSTSLTLIRLTISNRGDRILYLSGCPGVPSFVAERQDGRAWRQAGQFNVVCQAIYQPAYLTLSAGESHTSSFSWNSPGTFRLRVPFGGAVDETWARTSISPSFVVR